jgi:hypothetical protein
MYRLVAPVALDHFAIRFNSCISITCRPLADMTLFCCRHQSTESVRNFLIDKLKAAEMEIRNLMTSSSALKKQSVSDQEVRRRVGYTCYLVWSMFCCWLSCASPSWT